MRRITVANKCYFGLSKQLCSRVLSRKTKLTIYKTLILPVLLYGAETWVLSDRDKQALGVFERKILRKVFGPVKIHDEYRIRYNHELYELYADIDVLQRINVQRLRWLGHVVRMKDGAPAKEVFKWDVKENRRRGRPNLRWKDQVVKNLEQLGVENWRARAEDRSAWRGVVKKAQSTSGLYSR